MGIDELVKWVETLDAIPSKITLNSFTVITNVPKFFDGHISVLKSHPGDRRYIPFYKRLLKVYKMIVDNDNNVEY